MDGSSLEKCRQIGAMHVGYNGDADCCEIVTESAVGVRGDHLPSWPVITTTFAAEGQVEELAVEVIQFMALESERLTLGYELALP